MDVVFSAFDERVGPVAIFSTIKDPILTKKIAVKSIVSTLTSVRTSATERLEGEAIIPFPDEHRIAFIFYSSLDQKTEGGEHRVISLCCLIDNEKRSILYANATDLSQKAAKIKDDINKHYKYGQKISKELVSQLQNWGTILETQEMEIIAEKQLVLGVRGLLELFPVKKAFRVYEDPLIPLFLGLLAKIPVVLAGPNVEFLLEIADLLRGYMPDEELDVRLTIAHDVKSRLYSISYGIPKADLILLNEEQVKKSSFYREPVITVTIGSESRYTNYEAPSKATGYLEKMLKKLRRFDDETVIHIFLQREFVSFFSNLPKLKEFCLTEKRGKVKDIAKIFDVDEDYMILLSEALRRRRMVSATAINNMYMNDTDFQKMNSLDPESIGIVH